MSSRPRSLRAILCAAVAVATASAGLVTAQPASALIEVPGFPLPSADSFFDTPDDLESLANGEVIRSRAVNSRVLVINFPAEATQVLFRSTDSSGQAIAAATTVLVPEGEWTGEGSRPLVSYQAIINGTSEKCTPAYTLKTGLQQDSPLLAIPLGLGWAVTVPDYLGLDPAYPSGIQGAHIVLDGIRAVKSQPEFGVADSAVTLAGYSGGGVATAWAGELQSTYAPDVEIIAASQGGVPTNIEHIAAMSDGSAAFGLAFAAAIGFDRQYPQFDLLPKLNDKGLQYYDYAKNACTQELIANGVLMLGDGYASWSAITDNPDILSDPGISSVLKANNLGASPTKIPWPVYHVQNTADDIVIMDDLHESVDNWCAAGTHMVYEEQTIDLAGIITGVNHTAYGVGKIPQMFGFLIDAVDGNVPASTCKA